MTPSLAHSEGIAVCMLISLLPTLHECMHVREMMELTELHPQHSRRHQGFPTSPPLLPIDASVLE